MLVLQKKEILKVLLSSFSFWQLQVHRGVYRRPVRSISTGGAENQAHATQLSWYSHPCMPVLHRSHRALAEIPGLGDHEKTRQQGETHFALSSYWCPYLCHGVFSLLQFAHLETRGWYVQRPVFTLGCFRCQINSCLLLLVLLMTVTCSSALVAEDS